MTHNQFDDDQLEHILNNAPKLSDRRSKEEVLNRLLADARLQDNVHLQEAVQQPIEEMSAQEQQQSTETTKRKNRKWPILMSVAAVFALTVGVGSMFMNNNHSKLDQATAPDIAPYSTMEDAPAAKSAENHDNFFGFEHCCRTC